MPAPAKAREREARPRLMTEKRARRVARRIAKRLFINGQGDRAERPVLTIDRAGEGNDRNLGGWGEAPVADQIARVLMGLRS